MSNGTNGFLPAIPLLVNSFPVYSGGSPLKIESLILQMYIIMDSVGT